MPITLICFDLGGVVVRICRSISEALGNAGLDLRLPPDQLDHLMLRLIPLYERYQTGRIGTARFTAEFSSAIDDLYSPAEILKMHRAWLCGEYPGVAGVISRLNAAGLTTACLSNTNIDHWERMALPDYVSIAAMHHRLASHELGLHKPDPAIYRAFEERLDAAGQTILFFDDSIENVDAARSRGWNAVHIDHAGDTTGQIDASLKTLGIGGH